MAVGSLILGTLLVALAALRILRVREQRAQRLQVAWIAEGDEVRLLLAALAGDYRLTRQEVRNTWVLGGVLALLVSIAIGRLSSIWFEGPGTAGLAGFGRMLSFPPALAAGGVVLGSGLVAIHWSTKRTLCIRAESVEEHSGMPFGSWRLHGAAIARVGREHSGDGALVFETTSGMCRTVRTGEALATALSSSIPHGPSS